MDLLNQAISAWALNKASKKADTTFEEVSKASKEDKKEEKGREEEYSLLPWQPKTQRMGGFFMIRVEERAFIFCSNEAVDT